MKILVFSDTHGDISKAVKVIKEAKNIDLIIHLGDYSSDAQKLAFDFPEIPVEYIGGNCDFMDGDVPTEKLLECNGKVIFLTHGHRYSVKWNYNKLSYKAEETSADLLLFGHTHIPYLCVQKNCYLLNPGSISSPRGGGDESYAVIEINSHGIKPEILRYNQHVR